MLIIQCVPESTLNIAPIFKGGGMFKLITNMLETTTEVDILVTVTPQNFYFQAFKVLHVLHHFFQ
jgi:hypothetical protein